MDENRSEVVAAVPKMDERGARTPSGNRKIVQKRRRSVTPMRPVAIAPKTDSQKSPKSFELNQSVMMKSEPGFVTIAPKTYKMSSFDRYRVTENNSVAVSNPDSAGKRMRLAPGNGATTRYIIVRNQNLDSSNGMFAANGDTSETVTRPKSKIQEYTIVPKNQQNANDTLQQYNIIDRSSLGDYSNFSIVPKFDASSTDHISSVSPSPVKLSLNENGNRIVSVPASSLNSVAASCGLVSLKSIATTVQTDEKLSDSNADIATASKIPGLQRPKSQKPVVIMQQLLSPARKMNSLKSKRILLQGLNKLVPLNIQNVKVESKIAPGPPKPNEVFNHESKIGDGDTVKSNYEPKNEFILKTEDFPAISSSQVDSVLKAIDMQGQNKEFISNEAGNNDGKKNRENDTIVGSKDMPASQPAEKSSRVESSQYTDIVANACNVGLHLKNETDRPLQNQKHVDSRAAKPSDKYIDSIQCYKCKDCPYMSLNDKQIVEHIEKEHSSTVDKEEKPVLKCPGCRNTFHYNASLFSHIVHDHQVHESEAHVMTEKLCHRGNTTDRTSYRKASPEIRVSKRENEKFETGQASAGRMRDQQRVENSLNSREMFTVDTDGGNFQTLESNLISECNEVQPLRKVTGMPVTTANNLETLNLQNLQFLDDMKILPIKNDNQSRKVRIMELKNGDRNFEFINFKNETKNEGEGYLQEEEEEVTDHAISSEEREFGNILDRELDQESAGLEAKKVKPKTKGRPKGSKTNTTKQSSADLKQLGYKCDAGECGVRMLAQENIVYHQKCHVHSTDGGDTNYRCPECFEFKSNNWNNMAGHLWRSHIIDMELHACDLCSYKTPSLSNLMNQHRGIHSDDRPFLCDNCGKGFKTTKQLRNHRALHRAKDKEPLECSKCRRVFSNMRLLKLHKDSVHMESKPFMCNFCTYSASTRSALKLHLRRHTGEKPFSCEQCAYSTGDHNSLRRHKLRHLGLKPYSCPHCTYACIQSSTYKVHLKNKHPGLDHGLMFSCQYCSYRSIKKENLLTHMAKHEQLGSSKSTAASDAPILVE